MTQPMSDQNNEEIDIFYILKRIKETLKKGNVSFFKGINFVLRNWIIITILVVIGASYGYYSTLEDKRDKKATVLIRVNFDAVNYVYNSLESLTEKVSQKDAKFLSKIGFDAEVPEITSIEIKPVINLREIVDQYEINNRNFEAVLKNIDFKDEDEETPIAETLISSYRYHTIELELTNNANDNTLIKLLAYLNNNATLQELKQVTNSDIREHVKMNKQTIKQIDKVLDTYTSNNSLASPSAQIYVVDKNFSINNIIETKIELQQKIESLNKYLVYSKDVVVFVNDPNVTFLNKGLLDKKAIFYPIVMIFLFLLLAFVRFIYIVLRESAKQTELKE